MSKPRISRKDRWDCHDCGVKEGEIHLLNCDMEDCPFCGGQLLSCDCKYHKLGLYDAKKYTGETHYLPPDIFTKGLSDEQEDKWLDMLIEKGRIPYIQWPVMCAYCGEQWPEFFRVSDAEWEHYISPDMRHRLVCKKCWRHIKSVIDKAEIKMIAELDAMEAEELKAELLKEAGKRDIVTPQDIVARRMIR